MAEGRTDLGPIAKFKLNGLITGKGAVEWMQHRLQDVVHVSLVPAFLLSCILESCNAASLHPAGSNNVGSRA